MINRVQIKTLVNNKLNKVNKILKINHLKIKNKIQKKIKYLK